jgi:hypothetical protein
MDRTVNILMMGYTLFTAFQAQAVSRQGNYMEIPDLIKQYFLSTLNAIA